MKSDKVADPRPLGRDAAATRAKLLEAATSAFAAHGLAGVRVEQVAERAGVNKAMIYHYFGSKEDLYQSVLDDVVERFDPPADLQELRGWQSELSARFDETMLRLLTWEGLGGEKAGEPEIDPLAPEPNDRSNYDKQNHGRQERAQQDCEHVALAFLALAALPIVYPQVVRAVTGLGSEEAAFQSRWRGFQRRLAQVIESTTQAGKERVRLRPAASVSDDVLS